MKFHILNDDMRDQPSKPSVGAVRALFRALRRDFRRWQNARQRARRVVYTWPKVDQRDWQRHWAVYERATGQVLSYYLIEPKRGHVGRTGFSKALQDIQIGEEIC